MRQIIYYDPATGDIIRMVQSETADPAKYGPEPFIIFNAWNVDAPHKYRVVGGELTLKND